MILIISKTKRQAAEISDILHFMGIVSSAATPSEALNEISPIYRAVIISEPEKIYDEGDFLRRLRSYASKIPIFSLGEPKSPELYEANLTPTLSAAKIVSEIMNYTKSHSLDSPGDYRLSGFDLSVSLSTPMYLSKALPFTRTEAMIMRTMAKFYPEPLSAAKIIKYAFRNSRKPEASSIRTHVSSINKKFRKIAERNLITAYNGKGYIILTPEIMEELFSSAT